MYHKISKEKSGSTVFREKYHALQAYNVHENMHWLVFKAQGVKSMVSLACKWKLKIKTSLRVRKMNVHESLILKSLVPHDTDN